MWQRRHGLKNRGDHCASFFLCVVSNVKVKGSQCWCPGRVGLARVVGSGFSFLGLSTVFRAEFRRGFKTRGGQYGNYGAVSKLGIVNMERFLMRRWQSRGDRFPMFASWAGRAGEDGGGLE